MRIWKIVGGFVGLVAIIGVLVAIGQLLQSQFATQSADEAQATQIALLAEQLSIQEKMATSQAGVITSEPLVQELPATVINEVTRLVEVTIPPSSTVEEPTSPPLSPTFTPVSPTRTRKPEETVPPPTVTASPMSSPPIATQVPLSITPTRLPAPTMPVGPSVKLIGAGRDYDGEVQDCGCYILYELSGFAPNSPYTIDYDWDIVEDCWGDADFVSVRDLYHQNNEWLLDDTGHALDRTGFLYYRSGSYSYTFHDNAGAQASIQGSFEDTCALAP